MTVVRMDHPARVQVVLTRRSLWYTCILRKTDRSITVYHFALSGRIWEWKITDLLCVFTEPDGSFLARVPPGEGGRCI